MNVVFHGHVAVVEISSFAVDVIHRVVEELRHVRYHTLSALRIIAHLKVN